MRFCKETEGYTRGLAMHLSCQPTWRKLCAAKTPSKSTVIHIVLIPSDHPTFRAFDYYLSFMTKLRGKWR